MEYKVVKQESGYTIIKGGVGEYPTIWAQSTLEETLSVLRELFEKVGATK